MQKRGVTGASGSTTCPNKREIFAIDSASRTKSRLEWHVGIGFWPGHCLVIQVFAHRYCNIICSMLKFSMPCTFPENSRRTMFSSYQLGLPKWAQLWWHVLHNQTTLRKEHVLQNHPCSTNMKRLSAPHSSSHAGLLAVLYLQRNRRITAYGRRSVWVTKH